MRSGACLGISEQGNRTGEVQLRRKHFRDTDRKVFKAENIFTVDVNSYQKTDTFIYNYFGGQVDKSSRLVARKMAGNSNRSASATHDTTFSRRPAAWSFLVLGNESPISWIWIVHSELLGRCQRSCAFLDGAHQYFGTYGYRGCVFADDGMDHIGKQLSIWLCVRDEEQITTVYVC